MPRRKWIDHDQSAGLGESRARVLDLLRAADAPLGAQEIADRTGLHLNTARFHLDGLVDGGLAERRSESREQPGRPRVVYRASTSDGVSGTRSYRLLAEILTGMISSEVPDPARAATEAGRAWGHYLADEPPPFQRTDADAAIATLTRILSDVGFRAERAPAGSRPQILLRHCPFREIAEHNQDVVCSVHLGLMQGALAEMRTPVTAERLEPFIEPHLCRTRLRIDDPAAEAAPDQEDPLPAGKMPRRRPGPRR